MPTIKKTKSNITYGGGAIVVKNLKSYADDPVIVKKNEEARIAVSKLVFPDDLKK
ncbi:hypothetical protein [Mucilaginibacter psychrotolerans]|uniref:hypothetical protein n=1 Tax=Mucilaginibacter psychrotolerans TaxID=1524096 RepID=UPI001864423A|nr:hypothetical protein [Mucilaginibacter psychrotolerans]